MTQQLEPVTLAADTIPLGAAEYFVEICTPYKWSSGPDVTTLDPAAGYEPFASLAAAKAYAESRHHPSYGEDAVHVSYGVRYVTKLDPSPRTYRPPQTPSITNLPVA